ncbi:helix-turn-helix transcriptional regulator [Halomicrococcus sp. SG-WS-1]|uniref:helix-turn-helix transcriptional regulator n=1 Tax=Halomicrococcus sp. SG-WS-1 TaxID=3439057 RepID=UPI003F7AC786
MEEELADIEFLALSANRVTVLTVLSESARTRRELADATDASQATIGRILHDFEERSWIERDDGEYVATPTGALVADGFAEMLDIFEVEAKLRDVVEYLPADALDFDLRHLAAATITVPSQTRPNAPVQRVLDLIRDADDVRVFSHAFNVQSLTVVEERTTAGEQAFQGVFSRNVLDALAEDSRLRRRLASLLETDGADVRICEEEIPLAVTVADDVVHLLLRDENGVLQASVDTDDPAVKQWADETFARYRDAATPLDPGTLEEV